MSADIVRVGPAEVALLDRVAEDVFDHPIDAALLGDYLAAPGHLMVVAVEAGVVVGQARGMIHLNPDQKSALYIDNLGVAPPMQRQGLGRRLAEALIVWAK